MKTRALICAITMLIMVSTIPSFAASKRVTITGSLKGGKNYTVLLLSSSGSVISSRADSNGKFSFKNLKSSIIRGSTLQLTAPSGVYYGPIALAGKKGRAYETLSGKGVAKNTVKLGTISLSNGFGKLSRKLPNALLNKKTFVKADSKGAPVGAGKLGVVKVASSKVVSGAGDGTGGGGGNGGGGNGGGSLTGSDSDSDGVPDTFDAAPLGTTRLAGTDPEAASGVAHDSPFTTLYLGMPLTLNVNLPSGITTEAIDSVISGENVFNLIFFLSPPAEASGATGAHVICPDSLPYCRSTSAGGSTGWYGGISQSDPSLLNQHWSDYNADGSGYPNLEPVSSGGQTVFAAGIQPRVGTSQFHAGDVIQVAFTNGSSVLATRALTIAPYFISVPALASFDTGAGPVSVDYTSDAIPGSSPSNPIVLSSSSVKFSFWRPQRLAIPGAESGSYMDMGHLHYGVIFGGLPVEFTCGGLYSELNGLTEISSPLGSGGSPQVSDGATLWTLNNNADDAAPVSTNQLSFTVDLGTCLTRAGQAHGTYPLSLTAAGEDLSGGANRAVQLIYVNVP